MFHILAQNLSNSPNYTCHWRILIFLFPLPMSCGGVIVYLGSHRTVSTLHLGDSNLFSTDLPSLLFAYLHSNPLPQNLLLSGLGWTAHRWSIVVLNHTICLMILCFGEDYLVPLGRGLLPVLVGPSHLGFPS